MVVQVCTHSCTGVALAGSLASQLAVDPYTTNDSLQRVLRTGFHTESAGIALAGSLANQLAVEPYTTKIMLERYELENASQRDNAAIKKLYKQFSAWCAVTKACSFACASTSLVLAAFLFTLGSVVAYAPCSACMAVPLQLQTLGLVTCLGVFYVVHHRFTAFALAQARHQLSAEPGRAVAALVHCWNIKPPFMAFLVMGSFCHTQARHQLHAQPGRAGGGCHAWLVARRLRAARRHLMVRKRLSSWCRISLGVGARAVDVAHSWQPTALVVRVTMVIGVR